MSGRRWAVLALAFVLLVGAGSIAILARGGPSQHSAEAVVVALPRESAQVGSDVLDIVTLRYLAYLSSPTTQAQVAAREGVPDDIVSQTQVRRSPGTVNIAIVATAPSPEIAAQVANALASSAVAFSSADELVRVRVLTPAVVSG